MIRFSIVTVTYNAATHFMKTAESVLGQTYPHVEHLIIDGASTDETPQLAEHYAAMSAKQQSRHSVVWLSEKDNGLYDAMNKGLQRATGDYVLFLNAGDYLPQETTLETVAAQVGEGETLPAVLYGDTDIVDSQYRFLRHRHLSAPEQLTWRSFHRGMLVCHQAFYARTDIARTLLYNTAYRHSADVDWCIRVMREAERRQLSLRNVHAVVAHFLDGGDSAQNHRASLKERFRIMAKHYGLPLTVAMHLWFVIRGAVRAIRP